MNTHAALLDLIATLYAEGASAQARVAELEQENTALREALTAANASPGVSP